MWANGTGNEYKMPPENFNVYLNALLAFTRHDSQMVSPCHEISSSSTSWGSGVASCSLTESAVLGSIPGIDFFQKFFKYIFPLSFCNTYLGHLGFSVSVFPVEFAKSAITDPSFFFCLPLCASRTNLISSLSLSLFSLSIGTCEAVAKRLQWRKKKIAQVH